VVKVRESQGTQTPCFRYGPPTIWTGDTAVLGEGEWLGEGGAGAEEMEWGSYYLWQRF